VRLTVAGGAASRQTIVPVDFSFSPRAGDRRTLQMRGKMQAAPTRTGCSPTRATPRKRAFFEGVSSVGTATVEPPLRRRDHEWLDSRIADGGPNRLDQLLHLMGDEIVTWRRIADALGVVLNESGPV